MRAIKRAFHGCTTLVECIEAIGKFDYWMLDPDMDYYPPNLSQTTPIRDYDYYHQYLLNDVYKALSCIAPDDADPTEEKISLYTARTKAAIRLMRAIGWDFTNPLYRAELLGYYSIYINVSVALRNVMLQIYLEDCDGHHWINREINTPSRSHMYTATLTLMCHYNDMRYNNRGDNNRGNVLPDEMFIKALEYGADPNLTYENTSGYNCLEIIYNNKNSKLFCKFLEHGMKINDVATNHIVHRIVIDLYYCHRKQNDIFTSYYRCSPKQLSNIQECALALLDHGLDILLPDAIIFQNYEKLESDRLFHEKYKTRRHDMDCHSANCIDNGYNDTCGDSDCGDSDCSGCLCDAEISDYDDDPLDTVSTSAEFAYVNRDVSHNICYYPSLYRHGNILMCGDKVVLGAIYKRLLKYRDIATSHNSMLHKTLCDSMHANDANDASYTINRYANDRYASDIYSFIRWLIIINAVLNDKIRVTESPYQQKGDWMYDNNTVSPCIFAFRTKIRNLLYDEILQLTISYQC